MAFAWEKSCLYNFCRFAVWLSMLRDDSRVNFPQFCSVGGTLSKLALWRKEERREGFEKAAIIVVMMGFNCHFLPYNFLIVNFKAEIPTKKKRVREFLRFCNWLPFKRTEAIIPSLRGNRGRSKTYQGSTVAKHNRQLFSDLCMEYKIGRAHV